MSSTFFGLTIAGSGLSSFQTAINTTANNISNAKTDGYTKQVANRVASEALRVHAKYGTAGSGVTTSSITQLRSSYYDSKYWYNNSYVGYYDEKVSYNNQIQNYIKDDSTQTGFSTILTKMFNYLNTLSTNASDATVRKQFIESASSLSTYFSSVSNQMENLQKSCNSEISSQVSEINSIAQKVSVLNKEINQIEISGGYANELRDQRATLVDQLSKIVPVEVSETAVKNSDPTVKEDSEEYTTGATKYTITIDGQTLVDTYDYNTLECQARDTKVNQSDVDGLYDIVWSDTGSTFNPVSKSMSGELKALFEMRDGNNGGNFSGTVSSATADASGTGGTVTFSSNLSITDPNAMNMPSEGVITIGNREYNYSGFSYTTETAADGSEKISSYTFNLTDGDVSQITSSDKGSVGESINSMGIPYYLNQMNTFLRSFSSKFNQIEETGVDLNGNAMGAFFVAEKTDGTENDFTDYSNAVTDANAATPVTTHTYTISKSGASSEVYYWMTTDTFKVAQASIDDPSKFATESKTSYDNDADGVSSYDVATSLMKLQSGTTIYRNSSADSFLKVLISDNSIETQEATSFQSNFTNIQGAITTQRSSVSGVDEDEEALDLVKFQNAYNLSSKIISTLTEMYDRLILETGV